MMRPTTLICFLILLTGHLGAQWTPVDTNVFVWDLYAKGDTLYYSTDHGEIRWSNDQGMTWEDVSGTLPMGNVLNIGTGANGRLFCTVGSLVYRSDEPGVWEGAASMGSTATCMAMSDSLILVGAELSGGLQRSLDNGMSWALAGSPMANSYLTTVATDGNTIWAGRFGADAMVSSDSGASWSPIQGLTGENVFCLFHSDDLYAGDDGSIHCPGTPWNSYTTNYQILDMDRCEGYLAACGTFPGVFVSADECGSWYPIEAGYTEWQINAIALIGNVIYAGNSDGLWKLDLEVWSGVQDRAPSPRLDLWPNPAQESFMVSTPLGVEGPVQLVIHDLAGRSVLEQNVVSATTTVPVGHLASGRYTVLVRRTDGISSVPLVIER